MRAPDRRLLAVSAVTVIGIFAISVLYPSGRIPSLVDVLVLLSAFVIVFVLFLVLVWVVGALKLNDDRVAYAISASVLLVLDIVVFQRNLSSPHVFTFAVAAVVAITIAKFMTHGPGVR
jgi:membrane-associated HD superfamily phosphohydrolase